MAELATLARPYAEALFDVVQHGDLKQSIAELDGLAAVASNPALRAFADAPKADPQQVYDVVASVAGGTLSEPAKNLLKTVIENGRLTVLPEIANQFHTLASERAGVAQATIQSAFPLDAATLAGLLPTLERRFGRRLEPTVEVLPELIGGVRIIVGDQVLDTSVRARLDQMRMALTA